MGETAIYYVPQDELRFIGKDHEVAEAFWAKGVFVVTPDRFVYERIREWKKAGKPLPPWQYSFSFAEMGLGGSSTGEPVPNLIYDLICPSCLAAINDQAYEAWENEELEVPIQDRLVICGSCGKQHRSKDLQSIETPFTFSRFYMWVADIDEADWDPSFRATVESVLGPCNEYKAWET